ncbi:BrnT family toxin [Rhizobium sp. NFR07]|nr:BrnT family toxin [Rhizobium sp. NFR07]
MTIGFLEQRMVIFIWTPRGDDQRIISMRKANEREQKIYADRLHSL